MVLQDMQAPPPPKKVDGCSLQPLSWTSLKDKVMGNPPCEQNFEHHTWLFISLGRRNSQRVLLAPGLWPVVWLHGRVRNKEHSWGVGDEDG